MLLEGIKLNSSLVNNGACGYNIIYKYVFMAERCFPGPYLAKRFYRSTHILKSIVNNCSGGGTSSSTGMAAVVIQIARAPYQRKKHTH